MIIELPKKFIYSDREKRGTAYVSDGILYVSGKVNFENLMHTLTYILKGYETCYYCNEKINNKTRTVDHVFPRAWGGISIPENMVPCCKKCNQEKKDMTKAQYFKWKRCTTFDSKSQFYMQAIKENRACIKHGGLLLPKKWIVAYDVSKQTREIDFSGIEKRGNREIEDYFRTHKKRYPRPIIVSSNGWVFKGKHILCHAKQNDIRYVRAVILENVVKID